MIEAVKISRPKYQAAIRVLKDATVIWRHTFRDKDTGRVEGSELVVSNVKRCVYEAILESESTGEEHTCPPGDVEELEESVEKTDTSPDGNVSQLFGKSDGSVLPTVGENRPFGNQHHVVKDLPLVIDLDVSDELSGSDVLTPEQRMTNGEDHSTFASVATAWMEYGNGSVKPTDAGIYIKHVRDKGLDLKFLVGAQNYLNDKASQDRPTYMNLGNFIREESWLMYSDVKPGNINIPGAPKPEKQLEGNYIP